MDKTLVITIGLPASGKSTYAKQLVLDNPKYKRVNRDCLREMIDSGEFSKSKEKHIREIEVRMADYFFSVGFNVIIDDCNLVSSTQEMWKESAKKNNASLVYKDFTDVPLEECLKRDKKRQNYVGEAVIRKMYNDFLAPPISAPTRIEGVPDAIIVDLDGNLALFGNANPYDRDFSQDQLNEVVAGIVRNEMNYGITVLFTSGRNDKFRDQTVQWLQKYGFWNEHPLWVGKRFLFMRKDGDFRADYIIKEEIYRGNIEGKYNVKYCLDDRNQVIRLWRKLGLIALQTADGDF